MASYTMTIQDLALAYIWENDIVLPNMKVGTIAESYRSDLFDFDYNIPLDKDSFEINFIKYFYMREIGYETSNIFKLRLENYLNIYYDKWTVLWDGLLSDYSIRLHQDMMTTFSGNKASDLDESITSSGDSSNVSSSSANQDSSSRSIASSTPDTRLSLTETTNGDSIIQFADTIAEDSGLSNSSGNSRSNSTNRGRSNTNWKRTESDEHTINVEGLGTNDDNIQYEEFQRVYKTLYQVIFDDLDKLFMQLF